MENLNAFNADELVAADDLFADELEEQVSNAAASCLSTIATASSAGGCICCIGTACSGAVEIQ